MPNWDDLSTTPPKRDAPLRFDELSKEPVGTTLKPVDPRSKPVDVSNGRVFRAPAPRGILDRIKDAFNDAIEFGDSSAANHAATWLAKVTPSADDYSNRLVGMSPEQIAEARRLRVTQKVRDERDLAAARQAQDPAWREGDKWYSPGTVARATADFVGGMGGGLISDPTNLINPGGSIGRQVLHQGAIGFGSDILGQKLSQEEGVRDDIDLQQAALSGAMSAGGTGLVEGLKEYTPRLVSWWKNRGLETPDPATVDPVAMAAFDNDLSVLERFGLNADNFSTPEAVKIAADRARANAARLQEAPTFSPVAGEAPLPAHGVRYPSLEEVMSDAPPVRVTPEGQAISPEQVATGADLGRSRQQTADADLVSRANHAAGRPDGAVFDRMLGVESGTRQFDKNGRVITSPKGATGIAQIMPATGPEAARDAGLPWDPERFRTDPDYNKTLGQAYYQKLLRTFGGDERKAVAAYNAGPGRVQGLVKRLGEEWETGLPQETKDYLAKTKAGGGAATSERMASIIDADIPFDRKRRLINEALDEAERSQGDGVYRAEDFSGNVRDKAEAYNFDPFDAPQRGTTDNIGAAERPEARQSQTQAETEVRGARGESLASGASTRPFKAEPADANAKFFEERAGRQTETARESVDERFQRRQEAYEQMRRDYEAGQRRQREQQQERAQAGPGPEERYSKYDQKPDFDGDFVRVTPEGFVAGKEGNPVAFRNHREAARFAADNDLGGDFELHAYGANSSRVTLRRRDGSTYGQAPRAAEPFEPAAGRSDDLSQRQIGDEVSTRQQDEGVANPKSEGGVRAEQSQVGADDVASSPDLEGSTPSSRATPQAQPAAASRGRPSISEIHAEGQARARAGDFEYRDMGDGSTDVRDKVADARDQARATGGDPNKVRVRSGPELETVIDRTLAKDNKPKLDRDQREGAQRARDQFDENVRQAREDAETNSPRDADGKTMDDAARDFAEARNPGTSDRHAYRRKQDEDAFKRGARGQGSMADGPAYAAGKTWGDKNGRPGKTKIELETARGAKTTYETDATPEAVDRVAKQTSSLPIDRFYSNPFFDPELIKWAAKALVDPERVADLGKRLSQLASHLKGGTILKALDNAFDSSRLVGRPFASYWASNDARLRGLAARFKSDALTELADMFEARAGKADETDRTFHEAVRLKSAQFTQRMFKTLEPIIKDQAALGRVRDVLTGDSRRATEAERKIAADLRKQLEEVHNYRLDAGEDIGKVENVYFPRVLDADAVAKDKPRFVRQAAELYRQLGADEPAKMAEAWWRRVVNEYAGIDGSLLDVRRAKAPGTTSGKERVLDETADRLLAKYYEKDPFAVLSAYMAGSVKRAEFTRRFGVKGRVDSPARADWIKEHGNKTQLQVLESRIQDDIIASEKSAGDAMELTNSIIEANLGILGNVSPTVRIGVSTLHAWNQLSKMDRSTVSSIVELAMGFARSGEVGKGMKFMFDAVTEFGRNITKLPPSDAKRYAESLGMILDAQLDQALLSRLSAVQTSAGIQKTLSGFYRAIGLHQLTEAQRTAGVKMGMRMLGDMAGDLSSSNQRIKVRAQKALAELGVKDHKAFADYMASKGNRPTFSDIERDAGQAAVFNTAISRIVSETIMDPTRAQKPLWASHPVGSLLFGLMSYSFGFKKKVLDRMARTGARAFTEKDPQLLAFAGLGLPAIVAMTHLMDTYLRPGIFGSTYDFENEDGSKMAMRLADRAGFFGSFSPLVNYFYGSKYNRNFLESFAGSVVGSIGQAAGKMFPNRNSANTNTAERGAAGAFYDVFVEPLIDGFAARYVGGPAATAIILGTGNRPGGELPSDREAFVSSLAGVDTSEDEGSSEKKSASGLPGL